MAETWRVVLANGEVREGALICDGAYVSVRHEGGLLVSAKVREILAPGESTRAEAIAAARREGAEAERAQCIGACERIAAQASTVARCSAGPAAATRFTGMHHGADLCANTIRALPVPPCSSDACRGTDEEKIARCEGAESMREAILAALHQSLSGDQLRAIRAAVIDGGAR